MKILDRILQIWRIKKGIKYITGTSKILDIGNYDDTLFRMLGRKVKYGVGIDPLAIPAKHQNYEVICGHFPNDLNDNETYDVITLFAVLEHIPTNEINRFAKAISNHLKPGGKLIITVPDTKVDNILNILTKLKLVHGMSLEQHHGYQIDDTEKIFNPYGLILQKHIKFQLGLNNLFVFVKK